MVANQAYTLPQKHREDREKLRPRDTMKTVRNVSHKISYRSNRSDVWEINKHRKRIYNTTQKINKPEQTMLTKHKDKLANTV